MTSQFTLRVAILAGLAIAIFSMIFLRLWYLEVLSGDRYLDAANDNRVREVRVDAPRGEILDRDGKLLVDNRTELALELQPEELPKQEEKRDAVIARVGEVIGMTPRKIERAIVEQQREIAGSPVVLRQGLGTRKVYFLRENQARFPGVSVEPVFARDYRLGTLAAHLFGSVGEVTAEQLAEPRYSNLEAGDTVGQTGIEYEYDRFLRGRPGTQRLQVDALGRPKGQLEGRDARAGDNLRLTIDSELQAVGEGALASFGLPGAFVAMDVDSGKILAIGSSPTFDPRVFTKPLSQRQYRALTSDETDAPLFNRAIGGGYPTGSVFKAITATAALEEKLITADEIVNDTGQIKVDVLTFKNAADAVFGPINLSDALKVSSDVYFYKLGVEAPAKGDRGAIQDWAARFGLGEFSGIDVPAEEDGLIPTPAWRNRLYELQETDRPWTLGDNINLSVGQGDLQATPLQMAIAYAAIANGGRVLRPHLAQQVESVTGETLHEIRPAPRRQIPISDATRSSILEGLRRAAMEQGGTSYEVFGNFKTQIAGKTGTAERGIGEEDQAWYVALAPYKDPEVVVAATVERGGFGVDTAAPIVARILEQYFGQASTPPVPVAEGATTLE